MNVGYLNYGFNAGSPEEWFKSADWTSRVFFKEDYGCRVYDLIFEYHKDEDYHNLVGVRMYDGLSNGCPAIKEVGLDEFKQIVGNNTIYNCNEWRVEWSWCGYSWNN